MEPFQHGQTHPPMTCRWAFPQPACHTRHTACPATRLHRLQRSHPIPGHGHRPRHRPWILPTACRSDHPSPTILLRSRITTTFPWRNHSCHRLAVAPTHDPRAARAILACKRTRFRLARLGHRLGRSSSRMIRWRRRHIRMLGTSRILCIAFEAVLEKLDCLCWQSEMWRKGNRFNEVTMFTSSDALGMCMMSFLLD